MPANTRVFVPPGVTTTISSPVTLNQGVSIVGGGTVNFTGTGVFKAAGNNVTLNVKVTSTDPRDLLDNTLTAGSYTGWNLDGLVLDGVSLEMSAIGRPFGDGTFATAGTAVIAASLNDIEVRNYRANYAVELAGVNNVTLNRPYVHDNGVDLNAGDGIKVLHGSSGVTVSRGVMARNTRDGLDCYNGHSTTVDDCDIYDNGGLGIDSKWRTADTIAVGTDTFTNNRVSRNLGGIHASTIGTLVQGNVCANNTDWNIRVGSAIDDISVFTENTQVLGNTCTGSGYGVLLGNAVRFITVDGNTCTGNNYGVGLSPQSQQCTVTNNRLTPNTVQPLLMNGTGHTISGNT